MEIRKDPISANLAPIPPPANLPALKQALHTQVLHLNQVINKILISPDKIDQTLCHDLVQSTISLNKLTEQGLTLTNHPELSRTLLETSRVLNTIINSPIYV